MQSRLLCLSLFLMLGVSAPALGQAGYYESDLTDYEDMVEGESRDVPCPTTLNERFHHYQPVYYETYAFLTVWQSKLTVYPLPSWNWYRAVPNAHVVSTDGKARWEGAEIQVHCWVYRAHYFIQHHYDPVAAGGRIIKLCEGGGGTVRDRETAYSGGDHDPYSSPYDPYDPSWSYDDLCSGATGGSTGGSTGAGDGTGGTRYEPGDDTGGETVDWETGIGNGGTSTCGDYARVEYVCIDVWIEGEGWVEWGCGYVTTC